MRLIDRCVEETLDALLASVRAGMSRALVLRGEPGIGKVDPAGLPVERAADLQVRTASVESEKALGTVAFRRPGQGQPR